MSSDAPYKNSSASSNLLQTVLDDLPPDVDISGWLDEFMERILAASESNPMVLRQSLQDFSGFLEAHSDFFTQHCSFSESHLMFLTSLAESCRPEYAFELSTVLQVASRNPDVAHLLLSFDLMDVCLAQLRSRSFDFRVRTTIFFTWSHLCEVAFQENPELALTFPFDVLETGSRGIDDLNILICLAKYCGDPEVVAHICGYLRSIPLTDATAFRFAWIMFQIARCHSENVIFIIDDPELKSGLISDNLFFRITGRVPFCDEKFFAPFVQFLVVAVRAIPLGTDLFEYLSKNIGITGLLVKANAFPDRALSVMQVFESLFEKSLGFVEQLLQEDNLLVLRELILLAPNRARIRAVRLIAERDVIDRIPSMLLPAFATCELIDVYIDVIDAGDYWEEILCLLSVLVMRLRPIEETHREVMGRLHELGFAERVVEMAASADPQIPPLTEASQFFCQEIESVLGGDG
jgi:hypothetical protein